MVTVTGHSAPAHGVAPAAVSAAELLAVIGPAGPERTAMLVALGRGLRPGGRRTGVARVYGPGSPDPYDRVGELLDLAAVHAGLRVGARRIHEALAAAGLTLADHPDPERPGVVPRRARFEHLGVCDQLLLAVALALIPAPDVLLVDPADLAVPAEGRIWARLRGVAAAGTLVIAAAPTADVAGDHAHRTVVLPHGAAV
ncbi:hypothetical protein ACIO6U_21290 [Streptomyces sp. NPDC087422]|uniref:hypothetical protein n=1 Tax=Streptomyces sp. NPDC087422 TaxID=3365786 RepID=UPI0037F26CF4